MDKRAIDHRKIKTEGWGTVKLVGGYVKVEWLMELTS